MVSPSTTLTSLLVGFLMGVGAASFLSTWSAVIAGLLVGLFGAFIVTRRRGRVTIFWTMVLVSIGLVSGAGRYALTSVSDNSIAHFTGRQAQVAGGIMRIERTHDAQKVTLDYLTVDGKSVDDRLLAFVPPFPRLEPGDRISISCDLQRPEPFDGFAYDRYLATKKIFATCFATYSPVLIEDVRYASLGVRFEDTRLRVNDLIARALPKPESDLLAGLLLGADNFSDGWSERFQITGTSHIVAASGYNIALVAKILFVLLIVTGLQRRQAFYFLLVGIIAYVLLAGAEAAVIRAGVMGILVLCAQHLGRATTMRNVLLLTASIMIALTPTLLRDDVGFQLSMLSTIGLLTLADPLGKKLVFIPKDFGLRESFASTLAATIFAFPVIIISFGSISLLSPFVNLLVLPILPYSMLFGTVAVVMASLNKIVALPFVILGSNLLHLVLFIIRAMSELRFLLMPIHPVLIGLLCIGWLIGLTFLWRRVVRI